MKQKKIDKVIEEFRKNGYENLEVKNLVLSNPKWEQSIVSTEDDLVSNINRKSHKYRIKKSGITGLTGGQTNRLFEEFHKMLDKQDMKAVIATPAKGPDGGCKMSPEAIESVLKQFDKDQSSDNLEFEIEGEYVQSTMSRKGLEDNIKVFGMVYRVKPGITTTNQLPLLPPVIIVTASIEPSEFYEGKYFISDTIYFNAKEDGEAWLDFMKKFEVSI